MSSMTEREFINFFYNPRKKRQLSEVDDGLDDLSKYFLQLSGLEYNEEGEAQLISSVLDVQKLLRAGNTITDVEISSTTGQPVITIAGQRIPIPPEEYESVIQAQQEQDSLLQQALAPTNQTTTRGVLPSMEPLELRESNKPSALQAKTLEDLYDFYGLEGDQRTFYNLEAKHDAATNIGSRAMGYGPITKKVAQAYKARGNRLLEEINKLESKQEVTDLAPHEEKRLDLLLDRYENKYEDFPQLQPQPLQAIDAAIRKRAHSPIIEPERRRIEQQELEEQREIEKQLDEQLDEKLAEMAGDNQKSEQKKREELERAKKILKVREERRQFMAEPSSPLANAVQLAEDTKKKETVANVLNKTLNTPIEVMKSQGSIQPGQNANISTDELKEEVLGSNSEGNQIDETEATTPSTGNEKIIVDGEYKYILNREERKLSIQKLQSDNNLYKEVMNQDDWARLPKAQQDQVMQNVVKAEKKQDASGVIIEGGLPLIMTEAIGMTGRYDDYIGKTLESIPSKMETLVDGDYTYYYLNGEPKGIFNSKGKKFPMNEVAKKVMLEKYEAKRKEEKVLREEGQSAIDQIVEESTPTQTNLEEVSETIAKEEPKTLKQLGQKAKQNFQGLGDEQKAMMGLMGLEVLSEGVNYLGPARKEARDRIEILEGRRERGQLGVDERQDADTMKYMTRPVRALAEETEREQQAVMAGMGETRSAADLRRLRDSRDAQMTDALSRAGQEVTRQQMARKEMEKRELNQLQAYQQENLRNLTNRITGAAANMAGTFGANVAAEADIQRELSPENIEKYIQILRQANPNATETELRRMATDFGIEKARAKLYTGL